VAALCCSAGFEAEMKIDLRNSVKFLVKLKKNSDMNEEAIVAFEGTNFTNNKNSKE
jgi:hypothetical protein